MLKETEIFSLFFCGPRIPKATTLNTVGQILIILFFYPAIFYYICNIIIKYSQVGYKVGSSPMEGHGCRVAPCRKVRFLP